MSLAVALLAAGLSTGTMGVSPEVRNNPLSHRAGSTCDLTAFRQAVDQGRTQATPLSDLPPGRMFSTVEVKVAGCSVAAIRYKGETVWVPFNPQPALSPAPLTFVQPGASALALER